MVESSFYCLLVFVAFINSNNLGSSFVTPYKMNGDILFLWKVFAFYLLPLLYLYMLQFILSFDPHLFNVTRGIYFRSAFLLYSVNLFVIKSFSVYLVLFCWILIIFLRPTFIFPTRTLWSVETSAPKDCLLIDMKSI